MAGFEGIGDFDSDDSWERYNAHQAAKGRTSFVPDPDQFRKAECENGVFVCVVDESAGLAEEAKEQ